MPLPYRHDIDGLRAIAVVFVVIFHAFPNTLPGGFFGVDIFFVLSGYLISLILFSSMREGTFRFTEFYLRRVHRLFPALLTVLLAALGLGWFLLTPRELAALSRHVAAGSFFVSNLLLRRESGYFDASAETKPLLHLWSLGIEEQFYLLFPIFLWGLARARANLFAGAAVMAVASYILQLVTFPVRPTDAFYLPQMRLWELLIGALLAHRALRVRSCEPIRGNHLASFAGLTMLAVSAIHFRGAGLRPWHCLVPTVGTALILAAGPSAWPNSRLLSAHWLTKLGRVSYPLYLWHWLLLSMLHLVTIGTDSPQQRAAAVALSLGLAWFTNRWIERPIRLGIFRQRSPVCLAAVMMLVGTAGWLGYSHRGFPLRPRWNAASSDPALDHYAKRAATPNYYERINNDLKRVLRRSHCYLHDYETGGEYEGVKETCLRLDSSRPNVLVIGDSTAADIAAAIRSAHPEINLLQVTAVACRADHLTTTNQRRRNYCRRMYDQALAFARQTKLDAILIGFLAGPTDNHTLDTLRLFRDTSNPVYFLGPDAAFTVDVPRILARRAPSDTAAALSRRFFQDRLWIVSEQHRQLAARQGVSFLDRLDVFCPQKICPLVGDNGEAYFADNHHLTPDGISYFGRRLREERSILSLVSRTGGKL